MSMPTGVRLCQRCRRMFPRDEVKFYAKEEMKMCTKCKASVDEWKL